MSPYIVHNPIDLVLSIQNKEKKRYKYQADTYYFARIHIQFVKK